MVLISSHLNNGTTAAAEFVSAGLNPSGSLREKTRLVTLWGRPGQEGMGVYRESSSIPGALSLDVYELKGDVWELVRTHAETHWIAPYPALGAQNHRDAGIAYSTWHTMSPAEVDRLRHLKTIKGGARKRRAG